jgi:hypothetical protein
MDPSIIIALKKILGGIVAILLIAGILKSKTLLIIDSVRKHLKKEFKLNTTKATRLYGNDIEAYLSQNYPDNPSFVELVIVNSFRPLLVLILISVLDFQNAFIILFEISLVILIFPIECYFGDKWKGKWWYIIIIISMWLTAFGILSYSSYLQTKLKDEKKSYKTEIPQIDTKDKNDSTSFH